MMSVVLLSKLVVCVSCLFLAVLLLVCLWRMFVAFPGLTNFHFYQKQHKLGSFNLLIIHI